MNKKEVSLFIVTGMSGAGKSTCLQALEDLGYHTIDNLPLFLAPSLLNKIEQATSPIAVGLDVRSMGFDAHQFASFLKDVLKQKTSSLIFLDCDDETLKQRYNITRRRHPLTFQHSLDDGIAAERSLLSSIKPLANLIIDTTQLSIADCKRFIRQHFESSPLQHFKLMISSFSYRGGVPRDSDFVFDARFLSNPFYEKNISHLSGEDEDIEDFLLQDPLFQSFFDKVTLLLEELIPRFIRDTRSYLNISFGCTGGRHRSVFLAKKITQYFEKKYHTALFHRDIERFK